VATNTSVPLNGCVIDHNVIYGPAAVVDQPPNCSLSANMMNTNPQLVNITTPPYDFHLKDTSPCINAAVVGTGSGPDYYGIVRPQGAAPDIGVSEYTTVLPPIPPPTPPSLSISITWVGNVPSCTVKAN